jgi:hypothetical protein
VEWRESRKKEQRIQPYYRNNEITSLRNRFLQGLLSPNCYKIRKGGEERIPSALNVLPDRLLLQDKQEARGPEIPVRRIEQWARDSQLNIQESQSKILSHSIHIEF